MLIPAAQNKLFNDIRFWIAVFFVVRLYGVTLPPLEILHNIRQTDTLMIARNFYEQSSNIFFPIADVAGDKTGIVGSEFPIFNYLIFLVSTVFGFENWYGRLINLIVSSFGVFYFHKIIRSYFGERAAFNSAIILLASMWFIYSRKTMPDTFAASLCIISLYHGLRWFDGRSAINLLLFLIFGMFGGLSKISALPILSVLAIPMMSRRNDIQSKFWIVAASAGILAAVSAWYFWWAPYLKDTYGYDMFFMGFPFAEGARQIVSLWPRVLYRFYDTALKYVGFAAFAFGIFIFIRKKKWLPLWVFAVFLITFVFIMIKEGIMFTTNEYYVIMAVPAMAFIAGSGLAEIENRKIVAVMLIIICTEGILNKYHDFKIKQPYAAMLELESIMDKVSSRHDLIAINGMGSGTPMFFAHRKGWLVYNTQFIDELESFKKKGCKFFVILKKHPWADIDLPHKIVHDSEYFKVYKVQ